MSGSATTGLTAGKHAAAAREASAMMKRLANPARLMIASTLSRGECSVGELEALLNIQQPTLSQQLADLREAGIIVPRREAKQVFYRLAEGRAAALVAAIGAIFGEEAPAMPALAAPEPVTERPLEAAGFARILPFDRAA